MLADNLVPAMLVRKSAAAYYTPVAAVAPFAIALLYPLKLHTLQAVAY